MHRGVLARSVVLTLAAAGAAAVGVRPAPVESCFEGPDGLSICPASELARATDRGPVPLEPWVVGEGGRSVRLHAARDETVAFQIILRAPPRPARRIVQVEVSDLSGPRGSTIAAAEAVRRFVGHPVWVEPGRHSWGVPSEVLPWPAAYPDALVPLEPGCPPAPGTEPPPPPPIVVPPPGGRNRTVWIDLGIPPDTVPGRYRGVVTVRSGAEQAHLSLSVVVHAARLPAKPSLAALGELYDAYQTEGVGTSRASVAWQRMARCVQQMAHRHRVVFVEREPGPAPPRPPFDEEGWGAYDAAHGAALDGTLFSPEHGYRGPGASTPVGVWRVPWPERAYHRIERPLGDAEIATYRALARAWDEHAAARGWERSRFVAYLFDEVDTPQDTEGSADALDPQVVRRAHAEIRRVQAALDAGATARPIDLMWVGQANPGDWVGRSGLDLRGTIRTWVPAAAEAVPSFLRTRVRAGEQAWFYHGGHPFVGVHVVNASGIELRSWGWIAARYGLTGMLMWAVNLGDPRRPYEMPSYTPTDDRFGNGTLLYPGAKLPEIGLAARSEPVPSMRLKAWRAGLQDADLAALAEAAGRGPAARRVLEQMVPRALSLGRGRAAWPSDAGAWVRARRRLLELASGE